MTHNNKTKKAHNASKLPPHAATFHGVHEWFVYNFEKLGWMVLAKAKGYEYKIATYKKSIEHLLKTLEHLMTEYEEKDRLHDLKVLHMQTICLHDHVMKHL
jgi:hypothetical protein